MTSIPSLPPSSSTPSIGTKFVSQSARGSDAHTDPSFEASQDPAPISHAPRTERERVGERGKYEATEPWRSRKGDRLG